MRGRRPRSSWVVAVVATGLLLSVPAASSGAGCDFGVHFARDMGDSDELTDIDFVDGEGWAVGTTDILADRSVILRFDQGRWSVDERPEGLLLRSVSAPAAQDVWAAGSERTAGRRVDSAILHWDGVAWSRFGTPSPGTHSYLFGIDALSPTDAWAVGRFVKDGTERSLVLHYDGVAWTRVKAPTSKTDFVALTSVAAIAPNDAWAVGSEGSTRMFALHWDGTSWTRIAVPKSLRHVDGYLTDVDASSADNVWMVGWRTSSDYKTRNGAAALRWDGTGWTKAHPPDTPRSEVLEAVDVTDQGDVWTAGTRWMPGSVRNPIALHYDDEWKRLHVDKIDGDGFLSGVAGDAPGKAWAVGSYADGWVIDRSDRDC